MVKTSCRCLTSRAEVVCDHHINHLNRLGGLETVGGTAENPSPLFYPLRYTWCTPRMNRHSRSTETALLACSGRHSMHQPVYMLAMDPLCNLHAFVREHCSDKRQLCHIAGLVLVWHCVFLWAIEGVKYTIKT